MRRCFPSLAALVMMPLLADVSNATYRQERTGKTEKKKGPVSNPNQGKPKQTKSTAQNQADRGYQTSDTKRAFQKKTAGVEQKRNPHNAGGQGAQGGARDQRHDNGNRADATNTQARADKANKKKDAKFNYGAALKKDQSVQNRKDKAANVQASKNKKDQDPNCRAGGSGGGKPKAGGSGGGKPKAGGKRK